ncbi:MAG: response regulator [Pirellulaceae bacterium]
MLRAPDIENDFQRVAALHALQILDTPPEERFDRITRLAADIFQVPVALVSLVDANRQWFKSCHGLDVSETGRDISFCGHTIVQADTFIVENALEDPRFADNPLVTGDPYIRFYAGQPLSVDGLLVGTLCLIDRVPRSFDDQQRRILRDLASIAATELDLVNLADVHQQLLDAQLQEKRLEQERDRIFVNSLDFQCVATLDGRFERINPVFSRKLGYTDEEILATPFMEFIHEEDREESERALEQLARGDDVVQFENRFRCKDGTYRWLAWNCPAPDDDGLLYAVARDVTRKKKIERALRESEARFKTLVEHSPEAIVLLELENQRFVDANRNAEKLFGLDREALLSAGPVDLSPPVQEDGTPSEEIAKQRIAEALEGNAAVFEWLHLRSDGALVPCEVRLVPLPGKPPMIRASITDISWRKKVEADLRRAKDAAEAASRAKSDFLANMSHEIRTPMNAVIGMTEMVLDMELSDVQRDYLKTVLESAESLMTIINEILDFSKIEAGKLQLESLPFSLRETLGDTMKSLALRAHSTGLELAWHVNADIPDLLTGDAARLRQVIVNLVGNSIKFTEQGEIVVDVEQVACQENEVELKFCVADTGVGIPQDRLHAIFGAFDQVDSSTTRRFGGTGLGLAICSRLVSMMQGRIWVDSEPGEGAKFFFTCKFDVRDDVLVEAHHDMAKLQDVKVLVVDDNATNRRFMEELLRKWNMHVTLATGARQALDLLEASVAFGEKISLIITDLHMPDMDGFDLSRAVRESPELRDSDILLLTSGARQMDADLCRKLGIARHMLKPVKQSELLSAIFFATGKRGGLRERRVVAQEEFSAIGPQRILLVEDGMANQKLASALLRRWGHTVTVADNGLQALEKYEQEPFDLVLMDVQMPEMDGLEATREIRRREQKSGRHTPIIAMTAHALRGDRDNCLTAGMDGFLSKPVRKKQLYGAMLEMMGRSVPANVAESSHRTVTNQQSTTAIDWDYALEWFAGDEELLQNICRAAYEDLTNLNQQLTEAVDQQDAAIIVHAAHRMQGTLRVFKNEAMWEILYQLESLSRSGELDKVSPLYATGQPLLDRILRELSDRVND